jgi:hypothetical protein
MADTSKLRGVNGYLYGSTFAAVSTTSAALTANTWYKVVAVSTATSGFPSGITVNDVIYNSTLVNITAVAGDKYQAITLTKLAFVTSVSNSNAKEKFEDTVQTDAIKSYQVGTKPEVTGTINGYFIIDDTMQDTILKKFKVFMSYSSTGAVTRTEPNAEDFHAFLSLSESTAEPYKMWEYKPMIIDSFTADKPMEGPVTFNFNYTENGGEKPSFHKIPTT